MTSNYKQLIKVVTFFLRGVIILAGEKTPEAAWARSAASLMRLAGKARPTQPSQGKASQAAEPNQPAQKSAFGRPGGEARGTFLTTGPQILVPRFWSPDSGPQILVPRFRSPPFGPQNPQNLIAHNLTHMPRQNFTRPPFDTEIRPGSF